MPLRASAGAGVVNEPAARSKWRWSASRASESAGTWSSGQIALLLALLVALGLLLRLASFGDSAYGDEVGTVYIVTGHGLGRVIYLLSGHTTEVTPPLFFVVAWISSQLFGTSIESLRLISLLSGLATIPLTYLLGRFTLGVRAGLLAAALVALSPFITFYSTEARPYALLLVLCLVSTLALLRALRSGGRAWWVVYAVASCAAIYTHFTAVFLLLVQFAWALVIYPRSRGPLLAANLGAAIGFAPWIPTLIKDLRTPDADLHALFEPLTLHGIRIDLGQLWIGSPFQPVTTIPGVLGIVLVLAGLGVAAGAAALGRRQRRTPTPLGRKRDVVLIVLLALAVPAAVALYSSVRTSVWNPKDLISSWPGFAVLLGATAAAARPAWRMLAPALLVAAFAIGAVKMLHSSYHRPNYDAAVAYIRHAGNVRDPVVNWPDLTPGPPSELDVAFDFVAGSRHNPVIRLGLAPLQTVLKARPFTGSPPQTGEVVAREAARLAGSGKLFLVLPGVAPVPALETMRRQHVTSTPTSSILVLLAAFMGALPPRFHLVAVHTYSGLHHVGVYTFEG